MAAESGNGENPEEFQKRNDDRFQILENKLDSLARDVNRVNLALQKIEEKLHRSIAEQKIEKTFLSIQSTNQKDAIKYWKLVVSHTDESEIHENLQHVIKFAYAGKRDNFYPILDFIVQNKLYSGYPILYSQLKENNHIYDGQEIFVFAKSLKNICGVVSVLYQSFPKIVHDVISGPVVLQNTDNLGYLIAHELPECQTREQCYGNPLQQVFLHQFSPSDTQSQLAFYGKRAFWKFIFPTDANHTIYSGFHIKNQFEDNSLILKLRGTTFFLRDSYIFDSYYAGMLQCQYHPQLDIRKGEDELKIALREKYVPKTEFFFSRRFEKIHKIGLERRSIYPMGDLTGYFWKVIPAPTDSVNNDDIEENYIKNNAECVF